MSLFTTTRTAEVPAVPSTSPAEPAAPEVLQIGSVVLVCVDTTIWRPMTIVSIGREGRLSGVIQCDPNDYQLPAFRGALDRVQDPGRIHGRPTIACPIGYGQQLAEGDAVGHWRRR